MKKIIITIVLINQLVAASVFAQNVGINDSGLPPDASALLDIRSSAGNKGLLIPRVALSSTASNAPIGVGVATSLLIYNTVTITDVTPGYYYWNGTKWERLADASATVGGNGVATRVAFWSSASTLSSNANLYWDNTNSRLGIGTTAPSQKLTIAGTGGVFGVDNAAVFQAKNAAGVYENFLFPRWSDNVTYLNYGSAGFNIRNNGSVNTMFVTNTNRVGIGTVAPTYKLHVTGNIFADGGWLRVSGNKGLYFETYGGGFYMLDNTWIRTYNNKNFYQNTGIMRTDGTFQVGNGGATFQVVNGGSMTYKDGTQAVNKVLTSDANGVASWQDPNGLVSSALEVPTGVQVFTANGTFTVPAGVTFIKVITGGGGGGAQGKNGCGGGTSNGGGGGVSYAGLSVTPGSNHTVVVGTGGAGCNSSTCAAGSGTASSFDGGVVAGGGGGGSFTVQGVGGSGTIAGNPGVGASGGGDGIIFDFNTGQRGATGSQGLPGGGQGLSGGGGGVRGGTSCSANNGFGGAGGRGSVVVMW